MRWRAKHGGWYWTVDSLCKTYRDFDLERSLDNLRYEAGDYYKTKAEAQAAAERVAKAYLSEETP
jgi:hypothetical protein